MAQLFIHRAGERRFYTLFFVILSWILMTVIAEFQDFNADEFEEHHHVPPVLSESLFSAE